MRSSSAGGIVESVFAVAMKQHAREIEGDLEVVIAEGVVLLGVEHLEQRRRRVAAEVGAELVDLVEQEDGIARARAPQALQDAARHRADVGAPVAADLGLVAHAAERRARELAAHRARDRACRARSCRRRAGRRSRGSAPSPRARACAPRGTRGCGPSPSRGRGGRRRARGARRARSSWSSVSLRPRAGRPATRGRCGSGGDRARAAAARERRFSSRSAWARAASAAASRPRASRAARRPRGSPASPSPISVLDLAHARRSRRSRRFGIDLARRRRLRRSAPLRLGDRHLALEVRARRARGASRDRAPRAARSRSSGDSGTFEATRSASRPGVGMPGDEALPLVGVVVAQVDHALRRARSRGCPPASRSALGARDSSERRRCARAARGSCAAPAPKRVARDADHDRLLAVAPRVDHAHDRGDARDRVEVAELRAPRSSGSRWVATIRKPPSRRPRRAPRASGAADGRAAR